MNTRIECLESGECYKLVLNPHSMIWELADFDVEDLEAESLSNFYSNLMPSFEK